MNRGSGIQQQEENKPRGSKQQEDFTKLSSSSDQKTETSSKRDEETSSSRHGRSSSREDEAKMLGAKKSPQIKVTLGTGVDLLLGLYQSTWRERKGQQERSTRCQSRLLNTKEGDPSLVDKETTRRDRC